MPFFFTVHVLLKSVHFLLTIYIQKARRQHPQRTLRPHASKAYPECNLCQENGKSTQQNGRTRHWNVGQLYQYEARQHSRNQKRKQTRINGKFNVQLEKILALYHQKTEYFSPSSISKTREELCFCKSVFQSINNTILSTPILNIFTIN